MTTQILWRLGDADLPDTCDDFDALLALRFTSGVDDAELAVIERMFVNLHGSGAWGRLRERLLWSNISGSYAWHFDEYVTSGRWNEVTDEDIKNASSTWVDPD